MRKIENELATTNNTYITHDNNIFKAPCNYIIRNSNNNDILTAIHFQEGPLKENSLNGIFMEDLINICINRLENFQNSEYKCQENENALNSLRDSLKYLRERTERRKKENTLGTHNV